MSDEYVISEIRDYMLQNKNFTSEFVWTIAEIAKTDLGMYKLMQDWMLYIHAPSKQEAIEDDISDFYRAYLRCYP